jgi:hypothetical protein
VPGRLEAGLRVLDRVTAAAAGTTAETRLEIVNRGDTTWLAEPNNHGGYVIAAARIYDRQGRPMEPEQQWQPLPGDLGPGESCRLNCRFRFPDRPGRYAVRFDLLDVGLGWFADDLPAERLPGFDVTVG